MYAVEYLIIIKESDGFCNSTKTFINLLEANSNIKISSGNISFKNNDFKHEIKTGEITNKSQRFFNLKVICPNDESVEIFQALLKLVREIVYKFGGDVNLIWDDLGIHYSSLSYPMINNIENLMRKLITKFMLTSIGSEWDKEAIPNEVKSAADKNKRDRTNLLHQVDFIHLADFLFKAYPTKNKEELFSKISKCTKVEELSIGDLKDYLPRSNWDRYFKNVVNCEDEYLNKRWKQLYELRCLVAHSNFLIIDEYETIKRLCNEINSKLEEALEKLDLIIIPDGDKELIAENVIVNINELVGRFIAIWAKIESAINGAYNHFCTSNEKKAALSAQVNWLIENQLLSKDFLDSLAPLIQFRNELIHGGMKNIFNQEILLERIQEVDLFYVVHIMFEDPFMHNMDHMM